MIRIDTHKAQGRASIHNQNSEEVLPASGITLQRFTYWWTLHLRAYLSKDHTEVRTALTTEPLHHFPVVWPASVAKLTKDHPGVWQISGNFGRDTWRAETGIRKQMRLHSQSLPQWSLHPSCLFFLFWIPNANLASWACHALLSFSLLCSVTIINIVWAKPIINIAIKLKVHLLSSEIRRECPFSSLLFNTRFEVISIKSEKEIKWI